MNAFRARLEPLEAYRCASDGPARAFNALANMAALHLAQDPVLAERLRVFKVGYALQACATAADGQNMPLQATIPSWLALEVPSAPVGPLRGSVEAPAWPA